MNSAYVKAVETQAQWLRWTREYGYEEITESQYDAVPVYEMALETGDTYFMNKKFCSLVDHARRTVPDDLAFDMSWVLSKRGFLWLEEPFNCPNFGLLPGSVEKVVDIVAREQNIHWRDDATKNEVVEKKEIGINIKAIGWLPCTRVTDLADGKRCGKLAIGDDEAEGVIFLCFHEFTQGGYGMWSYFTLKPGDKVMDRIREFEEKTTKGGGEYKREGATDEMHEIRWVYTALYLMSQRLAVQVHAPVDRHTKRRAQRENRSVPDAIKVISLRKLEEARKKSEGEPNPVDWQWQWEVRGHWRNQFYAAANEHRPVFIEAYIKGPNDKPLKPVQPKFFAAVR
jgi:hypothetical protein